MHNNNAENWAIFLDHEVSPWYAIYIANIKTPTGKKYHSKAKCGTTQSSTLVPLSEAEKKGLTPCGKCY